VMKRRARYYLAGIARRGLFMNFTLFCFAS
jgi:hypothetical protein